MSAAASAEMIETPPVLNFEEIDYKEIEVEEVSEGPTASLVPRARPEWPSPSRPRGSARRRPAVQKRPPRPLGCAGMPGPPQCT